jgi:hypothetical protein
VFICPSEGESGATQAATLRKTLAMPYPPVLLEFYEKNKSFTSTVRPSFNSSRTDPECAYYPIRFDFNAELFWKECKAVDKLYFDHRAEDQTSGYGHHGWQSLTLHGIDKHKTKHFVHYGFKTFEEAGYHWTDACEELPNLSDFLQALPYIKFHRVRVMRLAPGGYIMPHTDGTDRAFGPLNIAVNNPVGCHFVFEGKGIVPFEPGTGMVLDVARRHVVINQSNEARYHVIVHGQYSAEIQAL